MFLALCLLLSKQVVANTPNLCTDNIKNLRLLKPSECDPTGRAGPTIKVGSTIYTNNEPHMIIGSPISATRKSKKFGRRRTTRKREKVDKKGEKEPKQKENKDKEPKKGNLIVYLPGTTDWPAQSSCLFEVLEANKYPVIGLTYGYLSRGDSYRNTRCGGLPSDENVECLTEQHNDAIYGGSYGFNRIHSDNNTFWAKVDPRDSIAGRLGLLLAKLDKDYPDEDWDTYYDDPSGDDLPTPNWSMLTFMGHSQGAGHAAFLANILPIAGAVMLSGPQDECLNCAEGATFWVDEPFMASKMTAFAHGNSTKGYETGLPVITDNWNRMAKTGTVSFSYPVEAVDTGSYDTSYDVCKTPIVTFLEPADITPDPIKPCGSKGHCSTALDAHAPVLENTSGENVYVLGMNIWPAVAGVTMCE